jgi:hypothetical protein
METSFYSLLIFMAILTEKAPSFLVLNILLCQRNIQNADCCLNYIRLDLLFLDTIHANLGCLLGKKQRLEDILTIET